MAPPPLNWVTIRAAYDYRCAYCNRFGGPMGIDLTRDHVVPTSRGGSNGMANVVPACRYCNAVKGDELGWVPNRPKYPEMLPGRDFGEPHRPTREPRKIREHTCPATYQVENLRAEVQRLRALCQVAGINPMQPHDAILGTGMDEPLSKRWARQNGVA